MPPSSIQYPPAERAPTPTDATQGATRLRTATGNRFSLSIRSFTSNR